MYDYLKKGQTHPSEPKQTQQQIAIESKRYKLIQDQLYIQGKEKALHLCVQKTNTKIFFSMQGLPMDIF